MDYVGACNAYLAVTRTISTNPREKNLPVITARTPADWDNLDQVTKNKIMKRLGTPPWMRQEDYA